MNFAVHVRPFTHEEHDRYQAGIISRLIRDGFDVNSQEEHGWTQLLNASGNGFPGTVKLLLSAGADTERLSNEGVTPLYIACQEGHREVVELLLRAGADKDMTHPAARPSRSTPR